MTCENVLGVKFMPCFTLQSLFQRGFNVITYSVNYVQDAYNACRVLW